MSHRTLVLKTPNMHGADVQGCQRDLNHRIGVWKVPYAIPVDGQWGPRSRDLAKSVLYGLGVDKGGDFNGVGPLDRLKIRHGWAILTPAERIRHHQRRDWRKRFAARYADATTISGVAKGIDVSNNNGHVDWARVAAAGYKFAWVKASEGQTFNDAFLLENVRGAHAHGLEVGAYHFLTPAGSPEGQAWHFAGRIRAAGLEKGDLLPVVDVEVPGVTMNDVAAFVTELRHELGVRPVIYTFPAFAHWTSTFGCKLWIANFNVKAPTIPPPWTKQTAWQFSSTAHVPGVARLCDVDTTQSIEELIWR